MIAALRSLPRTVWLIGLISLINDSASDMLYPLIPLYLSSVLMAGPRALGLIEGIAEATASLLKLVSGVVMDHTRRARPMILFGYSLAGFGRPLIAFVGSWFGLLVIRFADRIGKGLRSSPRDALLAASVAPQHRGLAFGVHRALDNAGAVIGPLMAALLLASGMPLKDIFLWSVVPALLCLVLALGIREVPLATPVHTAFNWHMGDMPPAFRRFLLVIALFSLGKSSSMFLLLRAQELGVAPTHIPLLWGGVSAVAMLFSAPLSALSDRVGRVRLLTAGYVAYGMIYWGLGLLTVHSPAVLFALFALYGLFLAATEGVEKALVADIAPAERNGTAYGWFNLTAGLFLLPASVIFGSLYELVSPFAAFAFSGGCALLAALLLMYWVNPGPATDGNAGQTSAQDG